MGPFRYLHALQVGTHSAHCLPYCHLPLYSTEITVWLTLSTDNDKLSKCKHCVNYSTGGPKKRRINNWQWQRQNKLSSKATLPMTSQTGVTSHLSVTFWEGKTFYLNLIDISPLSPSLEIFLRSRKCVPMATSFTLSESRIWIFMRAHSGGNISVKTICSFQMGS